MFILIGGLIVLYDDVVAVALGSSQLLLSSPFAPSWQMLLAAVLIYMGLTVWPWTRWRKLAISQ
jgi:hypothetical protein